VAGEEEAELDGEVAEVVISNLPRGGYASHRSLTAAELSLL